MFWTNTKRILRAGFTNAVRNSFVSLSSIFVMTMTLMILGSLLFLQGAVSQFVVYVKDKVDVNVYFLPDPDPEAVSDLLRAVANLPEVARATYVTADEELAQYKEANANDLSGLDLLEGKNPFGGSISIAAKDPSQYEQIVAFVEDQADPLMIDQVNFDDAQVKLAIDRLERITTYVERFGYIIIAFFALASILIAFNTVRLAIYTAREEISVMRLVGASNAYIRGPFIIETVIYGAVSALIAILFFFPVTFFFRLQAPDVLPIDIFALYLTQLWFFAPVLLGTGIVLAAISSFLAVRKYLSV